MAYVDDIPIEFYRDPKSGEMSEECEIHLPYPLMFRFAMKPANGLVKVRLVKVQSKRDLPYSGLAYRTDDTNTDINPHPNDLYEYNLHCFQTDLTSKSKSLPRNQTQTFDSEQVSNSGKPHQRYSLFQKRANLALADKPLSQTDDNLARGDRVGSDNSKPFLRVSFDRGGGEDSNSAIPRLLSNFNNSAVNDSMKNNGSRNTRSRNLSSQEINGTIDTNNMANSSKLLSDSNSKSILKPSRLQVGYSKSPGPSKSVRFSRLRTVIYFNLLHEETKAKAQAHQGKES